MTTFWNETAFVRVLSMPLEWVVSKRNYPQTPASPWFFYALACSRASQNGSRRGLTVPDSVPLFLRLISPSVRRP